MSLSTVLKSKRKELNLTLLEIAQKMGVSEATVQRWESGNIKSLRHERIVLLAQILQVSPHLLMGWEDFHDEHDYIKENAPSLFNESASPEAVELLSRIIQLSPENQSKLSELIDLYLNSQGSK